MSHDLEHGVVFSDMAFCDMTTSGGGWELVLRAASSNSVFTWDSAYWTSDDLLDSDVDEKFRIGNDVHFTASCHKFTKIFCCSACF